MADNIIVQKEGAVTTIQLNRLPKKNSFNNAMRHEVETALQDLTNDPKQKAVIVTGGEEVFCAGADIGEILEASTAELTYKHAREFQLLFDQIEALPQPVIAAVAGYALGGGCELALACDFRIASEGTRFGLPEIKIGAFPGGGGTQRLPRLIGTSKAKEMILTGDMIGVEEALACGLVMKVVPKGKLLEEAEGLATKLAALPRLAMEASKRVINKGIEIDLGSGLEMEARSFGNLATSHDLKEGTQAFLEKRKPNFTD
ncbi:MAG: enoyl-CoA hydratase [Candidatus Binatia bacterium]|jgi:enoyl-CoA hydratase|nr:enoyl-CoA hydratase [Candidatus Binatia bacterium]